MGIEFAVITAFVVGLIVGANVAKWMIYSGIRAGLDPNFGLRDHFQEKVDRIQQRIDVSRREIEQGVR